MSETPAWTTAEIRAYAARHGLARLDAAGLDRLRELADRVDATARALPRAPRKDDEPATVLRLPLG